jgi:hypothetical protein
MVGVCDAATPPMIRAMCASRYARAFLRRRLSAVGTVCNCPLPSSDRSVLSGETEPIALFVTL